MDRASTFTCVGLSLPGDQDPLRIWELRALQSPGSDSFPAPSSKGEGRRAAAEMCGVPGAASEGLVWTVMHSATAGGWRASREARSLVIAQLAAVERHDQALDAIESRLTALSPLPAYRAETDRHEAALLSEVTALQGMPTYQASPQWVLESYQGRPRVAVPDAGPEAIPHLQLYQQVERIEDARKLLVQLRRLVHHWAWIETQIGQERIALTTVDWGGDYQTTWLDGLSAREMDLHLDAVRLALASRHAMLRLIVVAITGALELAMKASVPGGQILLIPAVYRYVRDLLAEFGELPEGLAPARRLEPGVG